MAAASKASAPPKGKPSSSSKGGVEAALTRKLGPLPAWGWGGVGLAGAYLYRRLHPTTAATATTGDASGLGADTSGYGYGDPTGGGGGGSGAGDTPQLPTLPEPTVSSFDPNQFAQQLEGDLTRQENDFLQSLQQQATANAATEAARPAPAPPVVWPSASVTPAHPSAVLSSAGSTDAQKVASFETSVATVYPSIAASASSKIAAEEGPAYTPDAGQLAAQKVAQSALVPIHSAPPQKDVPAKSSSASGAAAVKSGAAKTNTQASKNARGG